MTKWKVGNYPMPNPQDEIRTDNNNNNILVNVKGELSYENTRSIDFSDFPRPSSQKSST